jgi:transcriptional antiterminator
MKSLFLAMSRDRKFIKKVQLLRTLANAEHSVTIKELMPAVNLTPSTIRAEINALNDELKSYIDITSPRQGEYLLLFKSNSSIETIVAVLIKEALTFKIIKSLFNNISFDLSDALDHFYVSRSTYLRTIKSMNEVLGNFNISIETAPLRFQGKEEDIRIFLFEFFALLGDAQVVSETVNEDSKLFLDLVQKHIPTPLYYNYFRISLWLSIAKTRWANQRYIKTSFEALEETVEDSLFFERFSAVIEQLSSLFNSQTPMPKGEFVWSFITSLHCLSYRTPSHANSIPYDYRYTNCEYQPEIRWEIQNIIGKLMPSVDPQEDIFMKIEGFLINSYLLLSLSSNYEVITADYREFIKTKYNILYTKWLLHLSSAVKNTKILNYKNVEDLTVCLISLLLSNSKVHFAKPLQVYFAIQGHTGFDEYIMERAKLYITRNMDVHFRINQPITLEDVENADIVVTNYNSFNYEQSSFHYIHMSTIPTTLDWKILKELFETLSRDSLDIQMEDSAF